MEGRMKLGLVFMCTVSAPDEVADFTAKAIRIAAETAYEVFVITTARTHQRVLETVKELVESGEQVFRVAGTEYILGNLKAALSLAHADWLGFVGEYDGITRDYVRVFEMEMSFQEHERAFGVLPQTHVAFNGEIFFAPDRAVGPPIIRRENAHRYLSLLVVDDGHDPLVKICQMAEQDGYRNFTLTTAPTYVMHLWRDCGKPWRGVYDELCRSVGTAAVDRPSFVAAFPSAVEEFKRERHEGAPWVLLLQERPCSRSAKMAMAYDNMGYNVAFGTRLSRIPLNWVNVLNRHLSALFTIPHRKALSKLVKGLEPGLVHFNNYPDTLMKWLKDELSEQPESERPGVVYDCHDVPALTFTVDSVETARAVLELEGELFEFSDAVLTVSEGQRDYIRRNYPGVDCRLVPTYMPEAALEWVKPPRGPRLENSMLYLGDINLSSYRDITGLLSAVTRLGYDVYLHSVNADTIGQILAGLRDVRVFAASPSYMERVWEVLPRYELGLLYFNPAKLPYSAAVALDLPERDTIIDHAVPNKFHEYLWAGIVPVVDRAFTSIVLEYGELCAFFDGPPGLPEVLSDCERLRKLRDNVQREARGMVLENALKEGLRDLLP